MARPKSKRVSFYKICSKCHKELSLENFYKDGSNKEGPRYRNECKECYKKIRAEHADAKSLAELEKITIIKHIEEGTDEIHNS